MIPHDAVDLEGKVGDRAREIIALLLEEGIIDDKGARMSIPRGIGTAK